MSTTAFTQAPGLAIAFLFYVGGVIGILATIGRRRLGGKLSLLLPLLPTTWAVWGLVIAATGLLQSSTRPPGIVLLVGPILMSTVLTIGVGPLGRAMKAQIPLAWLVGLQAFRLGVEIVIHGLWRIGWMPHVMTLEAGNIEILFAASAPAVAWAVAKGHASARSVLVWNAIGVLSLVNVVVRGVGSSPGPAHFLKTEVANIAMAQFPFTLIPAVMVPLAVALHIVTARAAGAAPRAMARVPVEG